MSQDAQHKTTILLAIDNDSFSLQELQHAIQLTQAKQAELLALFIENSDLLKIADLPFTQEISIFSRPEQPTDSNSMLATLQRLSRKMQQELEKLATEANIHWQYQQVRGTRADQLPAYMREADIIITGCWRPHEADYPQQKNRRKTLYCIYDDSPASGHALDLAQTLALDSQHPLHVVCDSADHEQQVHAMLKPGLVNPITEVQPRPLALQSLSHTLSHHDAELLFIPLNRELALQQPQMRELLDHSHLPIVMVK